MVESTSEVTGSEVQLPFTMMEIEGMNPAEARVLIAKDALALIEAEKITPKHLEYLSWSNHFVVIDSIQYRSLHEILDELPACAACALGTALVAAVRRFNRLFVNEIFIEGRAHRDNIVGYLGKFFSEAQLNLIEMAFEGRHYADEDKPDTSPYEECHRARVFGLKMEAKEIAEAIFKNIIANGGTFIP